MNLVIESDNEEAKEERETKKRIKQIKDTGLDKIIMLKCIEGQLLNNIYIIGQNGASIGRHSRNNNIVITESFVSRKHCKISYQDGLFWIKDQGSTTGTFL